MQTSSHSTESHFEWSQYFEDTYDSFLADWALANDSQQQAEKKVNSGCLGSFFFLYRDRRWIVFFGVLVN